MFLLKFIQSLLGNSTIMKRDPRGRPISQRPGVLPISLFGKMVSFHLFEDALWILIGSREAGFEIDIDVDKNSFFPPIKNYKTFSDDKYNYVSCTVATKSLSALLFIIVLLIVYLTCSFVILIIKLGFKLIKTVIPFIIIFHLIKKIFKDRKEFLARTGRKKNGFIAKE